MQRDLVMVGYLNVPLAIDCWYVPVLVISRLFLLRSFCMLIFSGVFRSPIVITSTVTIVPYFSNDTKGSFDETSVRTWPPSVKLVQEEWENPVGLKAEKRLFQMAQKRHRVDQIISKLRRADVELVKGKKVPEVCKLIGIAEQTYYQCGEKTETNRWLSEVRPLID